MQRAILRIQWKACWHLVVAISIAAFVLPIASVRLGWHASEGNLALFLTELQLWGYFYPLLATTAAVMLAIGAWMSDRRGQHVYALLLPVPRARYVWYRYAAGLVLLVPVVIALWLGDIIAVQGLDLPAGIRVFPHELALKFALALALMFGFGFALASASSRTIGIAIRVAGLLLAVHVAVILIVPNTNLLWSALKALAIFPGPLAALSGRWMLIDA